MFVMPTQLRLYIFNSKSMKKFLGNILIFLILIFSIFGTITVLTESGLRKSEYGNLKEWNDIFDKKVNADIIIQGSSRAWVQFNTYIIDSVLNVKSYNMGIDGSPFDIQYLRYKAYIQNNKAPKIILQNVDWDLMDKNQSVFQKYQFLPFTTNNEFRTELLNQNLLPKTDMYLPLFKYSGQLKAIQIGLSESLGLKHYTTEKHHGFAGSANSWDGTNLGKTRKEGKIKWVKNTQLEKQFMEFLKDCNRRNIKVVLLHAPIYYELATLFENQNNIIKYYKNIAEKHHLVFLDYSTDSISYSKNNFYNASHLNKRGEELFTSKLVIDLKKLNIVSSENTK